MSTCVCCTGASGEAFFVADTPCKPMGATRTAATSTGLCMPQSPFGVKVKTSPQNLGSGVKIIPETPEQGTLIPGRLRSSILTLRPADNENNMVEGVGAEKEGQDERSQQDAYRHWLMQLVTHLLVTKLMSNASHSRCRPCWCPRRLFHLTHANGSLLSMHSRQSNCNSRSGTESWPRVKASPCVQRCDQCRPSGSASHLSLAPPCYRRQGRQSVCGPLADMQQNMLYNTLVLRQAGSLQQCPGPMTPVLEGFYCFHVSHTQLWAVLQSPRALAESFSRQYAVRAKQTTAQTKFRRPCHLAPPAACGI